MHQGVVLAGSWGLGVLFGLVNVTGALIWGYGVRRFNMGNTLSRFTLLGLVAALACYAVGTPINALLALMGETTGIHDSARNLGRLDEAIAVLEAAPLHESTGTVPRVVLALALHSVGRKDEALQVAIESQVDALPRYRRSMRNYAAELTRSAVSADQELGEFDSVTVAESTPVQWEIPALLRASAEGRPRIVCICGSTRFRSEIVNANARLTLAGVVVLAPALVQQNDDTITDEQRRSLSDLHLRKIDLADAVLVIDPGEYIDESTKRDIDHARSTGKSVVKLSELIA